MIESLLQALEAALEPGLAIAMGATFLAGIVRGFSGFGAAMVQAPIFAILFTAPQAVATVVALGMLASMQLLPGSIRDTAWRDILPIGLTAALTIPLGAYVLLAIEADVMRRGISAMVLVTVLFLMSGFRYPGRPGLRGGLFTGGLSGVINGATSVGGPPVVIYMLAGPNTATINRASLITFYTGLNGLTLLSLVVNGVVSYATVARVLWLLPAQIVSLLVGTWLFHRATDVIYRRIAMGLLLAIALIGLFYTR